ncbi:hypothetical protein ACIRS1_05505 [Kitasatospora sp. NPDC101176]|uniref:hypothetical protein n=1 Tax=Kitasatospora sp. NPDC101176 TaxID=3364099 RepID=UPI0037F21844
MTVRLEEYFREAGYLDYRFEDFVALVDASVRAGLLRPEVGENWRERHDRLPDEVQWTEFAQWLADVLARFCGGDLLPPGGLHDSLAAEWTMAEERLAGANAAGLAGRQAYPGDFAGQQGYFGGSVGRQAYPADFAGQQGYFGGSVDQQAYPADFAGQQAYFGGSVDQQAYFGDPAEQDGHREQPAGSGTTATRLEEYFREAGYDYWFADFAVVVDASLQVGLPRPEAGENWRERHVRLPDQVQRTEFAQRLAYVLERSSGGDFLPAGLHAALVAEWTAAEDWLGSAHFGDFVDQAGHRHEFTEFADLVSAVCRAGQAPPSAGADWREWYLAVPSAAFDGEPGRIFTAVVERYCPGWRLETGHWHRALREEWLRAERWLKSALPFEDSLTYLETLARWHEPPAAPSRDWDGWAAEVVRAQPGWQATLDYLALFRGGLSPVPDFDRAVLAAWHGPTTRAADEDGTKTAAWAAPVGEVYPTPAQVRPVDTSDRPVPGGAAAGRPETIEDVVRRVLRGEGLPGDIELMVSSGVTAS